MKSLLAIWALLQGYKTYFVGLAAIVYAISQAWVGSIDIQTAAQMILAALAVMGVRSGITTALVQILLALGIHLPPNAGMVAAKKAVAAAAPVAKRVLPILLVLFMVCGPLLTACASPIGNLTPLETLRAVEAGFAFAEATYDSICSVNAPPAFCTDAGNQANYQKAKDALEAAFRTAEAAIAVSGNLDSASIRALLQVVADDWAAFNRIVNTVQAKEAARLHTAYQPIPL